jgi:hypothetical protein
VSETEEDQLVLSAASGEPPPPAAAAAATAALQPVLQKAVGANYFVGLQIEGGSPAFRAAAEAVHDEARRKWREHDAELEGKIHQVGPNFGPGRLLRL